MNDNTSRSPWGRVLKTTPLLPWRVGERLLGGDRPVIMGILNVTPDSFFDGGSYNTLDKALGHSEEMILAGADIIDVGGESTRPGSSPVSQDEETRRVVPVIGEICRRFSIPVSIDTTKSTVADAALAEGACIINDVTGMTQDPIMQETAVKHNASVVLCHIQGTPRDMQKDPRYNDVVLEVGKFFAERIQSLNSSGLPNEKIAVDPGIGFGKQLVHNYRLIAHLEEFGKLNCPILMGMSRKSFIGNTAGLESSDRLHPSTAAAVLAGLKGASILRVHDVRETREQLRMIHAILSEAGG